MLKSAQGLRVQFRGFLHTDSVGNPLEGLRDMVGLRLTTWPEMVELD